jgi:hypothetical protein
MAKLTKKEQQTLTVEEKEKYSFDLFEKRDDPDFIEQSKVFEEEMRNVEKKAAKINTHIPDRFKKKGKKL